MAILLAVALSWLCLPVGAEVPDVVNPAPESRQDSLTVSLVTCWPGPEIYELYGHEAIRVRSADMDSVWNYGIFDFREPNFVYRFVRGNADYLVAGYPFQWFLPEYLARGSRVEEQILDLSQEEASRLLSMLQTVSLPENRKYHYNYVRNNCATRIFELLDSVAGGEIIYPDSVSYGTFREEMRAYNVNYPWYQFGIDLVLGKGIDVPVSAREEMFVPVEMNRMVAGATLPDGRKLVRETGILNPGLGDVTLPPTPWYAAPGFWSVVAALSAAAVVVSDLRRRRIARFFYSLWFIVMGLAGCVVGFLVFFSSHEATSPNLLFLWLNPLQLLFGAVVWWKSQRPLAKALSAFDSIAIFGMLAVWPFQEQSAGFAVFPLAAATWLLAAAYTIIAYKLSSNNK